MKKILILLVLVSALSFANTPPKRELRGIWVASLGIDWPGTTGTSLAAIAKQKQELIDILDYHQKCGINAIFFHVRPMADACYKSPSEPWSSYITGVQGLAPADPEWDPLKFAIEEAHKRGMELHAWLNPYRVLSSGGSTSSLAQKNVYNQHPGWIIKCNGTQYRFLNPGLPEVRQYLVGIITDMTRRYNLDGVHFDDYFYPYTEYGSFDDASTFAAHPMGYSSTQLSKWRMNNVNLLLKEISDSVKAINSHVKFGISPMPSLSNDAGIYCDPISWLQGKYRDETGVDRTGEPYVDYVMPQMYGYRADLQMSDWGGWANGRHIYDGLAAYNISSANWPATVIPQQIGWSRKYPNNYGTVFFSSNSITDNLKGVGDSLANNYFRYPAFPPQMSWKDNVAPNAPRNLKFGPSGAQRGDLLSWDLPQIASDGDSARFYAVYKFDHSPSESELSDPSNLVLVTSQRKIDFSKQKWTPGTYYFTVTSLDWNNNESPMALPVLAVYNVPGKPSLAFPLDHAQNQRDTLRLSWRLTEHSVYDNLEVSTDSLFTTFFLKAGNLKDTSYSLTGMAGATTYFWRIKSGNSVGLGDYSDTYRFSTGFPSLLTLSQPAQGRVDVPKDTYFQWASLAGATGYEIQVGLGSSIAATNLVADSVLSGTSMKLKGLLAPDKIYCWRGRAINQFGTGLWSSTARFKVIDASSVGDLPSLPLEYKLMGNYPNPFNPTTRIQFSLKEAGFVSLKIYNILGAEVKTLINGRMKEGGHYVDFDGSQLPSGAYIYRLEAGGNKLSGKMILMK